MSNISIHSTTRVETGTVNLISRQRPDFNPLHHEGGDHQWILSLQTATVSTLVVEWIEIQANETIKKLKMVSTLVVEWIEIST